MATSNGDLLEVVNRSKCYKISKKLLCSSIPYFEKMFSCDLLESRENKVTLDLDESGFHNVMDWVDTGIFMLTFRNILQTYACCDYLLIESLKDRCYKFFKENFTLDHLQNIIPNIGPHSKLMILSTLNCFIRRHFLKISWTNAFLDYPIDVIEYILKLDLVIQSEYQVFKAICRWTNYKTDRDEHLIHLLKLIRWCHVDPSDLEKIKRDPLISKVPLDKIICKPDQCSSGCASNRVRINKPILIFKVDESTIEIILCDVPDFCYPCGQFKLDASLSVELLTDEHVTDILYENGTKCIRVDWKQKKFRYFETRSTKDAYYGQIYKYIISCGQTSQVRKWILKNPIKQATSFNLTDVHLEYDGYFIAIGPDGDYSNDLYLCSPLYHVSWFHDSFKIGSRHACLMKDSIYVIKSDLSTLMVDLATEKVIKSTLKDDGFQFYDLRLFSVGDTLYMYQMSTQKIFSYNQVTSRWSFMCQLVASRTLVAVTSTYSSFDGIQTLF